MTTWTQTSDTSITSAVSAVGAGQTLLNGWIDLVGNVWSTTALWSDTTSGDYYLSSIKESTPWTGGPLYRPETEDSKNQRLNASFRIDNNQTMWFMLRANRSTSTSGFTGYLVSIDGTADASRYVHIFAMVNGSTASSSQVSSGTFTATNGGLYNIDIQCLQVTTTTSEIIVQINDSTGASVFSYDTGSASSVINASALQNVTGSTGVCVYGTQNNTAGIQEITVYNGDAAATTTSTTYSLALNPTSLLLGASSTVSAQMNGTGPAAATVVTLSDGSAGGTFTPATLSFAAGVTTALTSVYKPAKSGTISVSGTNNQSLTNPTAQTLTITPVATTYTLTGSSSLTINTAGTYTLTPNAALSASVTVTPACTLAGTFSPATLTLASGSTTAVTFTFTPTASGSGTLSTTNSGTLTNPASLALTVSSQATAPSAPAFTLTAGSAQVTVNVTASASNGGATISGYPIYVGSSAGGESSTPVTTLTSTGSYVITGLTNGTPVYVKVGATNSVGTTLASEQTATPVAPVSGGTITVDSPAFLFSPGNWYGDTGRAGSSWRRTWNVGAYFVFTWTASASPSATLHLGPTGTGAYVTLYVNGVAATVSAAGDVKLSNITASSENVLFAIMDYTPQTTRWSMGANNLVVSGITLDTASSAGTSVAGSKGWVKLIGDSITEGVEANNNKNEIIYGYAFQVLQGLRNEGYEVCVSACGYSGYLVPGDSTGDVPPYYYVSGSTSGTGGTYTDSKSRWNKIDANISALDSVNHLSAYGTTGTEPAAIAVNYLTNEALSNYSQSDAQAAMTQAMIAHRTAAPDAWLFLIVPFGFHYSGKYDPSWLTVFNNAVQAYKTAYPTDARVAVIDIGSDLSNTLQKNQGWYISASDDVHPLAPGHALIAPVVQGALMTSMEGRKSQSYTFY
ncbi:SGNH/GDSL hydrolase family protein [Acetobacter conturbans]|uniref:Fibronectin type-III domain-containing protein n=1 Tax=Acetobacter conturbans TaxID=1737472 RepID=A0ABX0K2C7_9PROT|nr:SGNH/GDSL hydrolase family protein [Acetobacter conturbans]NHN88825.1 hypothetical protein [Acetobacter conturbans]